MKVLITGGDGFIGSHLADALIEGHQPALLDLAFRRNSTNIECKKIVGDVASADALLAPIQESNMVIHLAAISRVEVGEARPKECLSTNITGTLNVASLCAKYGKVLVYASSREVYGEPTRLPVAEDDPKHPISTYGVSKLAAEGIIRVLSRTRALRYVILRFSNVYGSPRDLPDRVTPKFMGLAIGDRPLPINGGEQVLDFNFIDDLIDGMRKLVEKIGQGALPNNDYNLVSGRGTSILDLAKLVKEVCNSKSELVFRDKRSYDVERFVGDGSKARAIGYQAKHELRDGLRIYRSRLEPFPRLPPT